MMEKDANLLPKSHKNSNTKAEAIKTSALSKKGEKKQLKSDKFQFRDDQKVYWTEQQEQAVEDYLRINEVWLSNKIKWELKAAQEQGRDPNWELILELENLIEDCKNPETQLKRDEIFRKKINKPLNKLVENIIFSFKLIRRDIDIKSLQHDCLGFLIEKFANFDPSQDTKAFSFYGTIVKHYLIGEKKDNDDKQNVNLEYESLKEEVNNIKKYELGECDHLEESSKFFNYIVSELKKEIYNSNVFDMSENDKNVGNAIIKIFETHMSVQVYSKNHLYQMIKEYTNLETKDITYSLGKFKTLFKISKQNFIKKNVNN